MRHRFQNSLFPQSTQQNKFSNLSTLESVFKNGLDKNAVSVWTEGQTERKRCILKQKNISVDKGFCFDKAERYHKKHLKLFLINVA